jgi:hypothetical protein
VSQYEQDPGPEVGAFHAETGVAAASLPEAKGLDPKDLPDLGPPAENAPSPNPPAEPKPVVEQPPTPPGAPPAVVGTDEPEDDPEYVLEEFAEHFEDARQQGDGSYMALCPVHDDTTPSLHISLGDEEDRILLHCHTGCNTEQVLEAVGLDWQNTFINDREDGDGGTPRPRRPKRLLDEEAKVRDEVYRGFIEHLELSTEDRAALKARGLSDEVIDRNGYRTLTPTSVDRACHEVWKRFGLDALQRIPGFRVHGMPDPRMKADKLYAVVFSSTQGLLIPVRIRSAGSSRPRSERATPAGSTSGSAARPPCPTSRSAPPCPPRWSESPRGR